MKTIIDTNIIVDVSLERQSFYPETIQVISFVYQKQIEGYISASSFSDLYYIIRKQKGRDLTLDFLRRIRTFCEIATVNNVAIDLALNTNFPDFEDAIQYSTAVINQLDAIVTRNTQDFPVVNPRILPPNLLIQELNNSV
ncbi:MAG: PIN domain-containing protein [Okeania sp. SIO3I5]|uniref:type II toxin-antitoxin system VapC family toxin n=1 Tax=Okeania sp. SIO3I5 TaxID=2607805 RepID=UPI0013B7E144|nr:PIN domain-containing protein [Okeania sp. SIO3I5]NEQ37677.1 PIN domain-containing protein [Okeania sp. SIO3I5]